MTATTPAIQVITTENSSAPSCPSWCKQHIPCPPSGLLHRCDLGEAWGSTDEDKVSLALERQDDDGVAGEPCLSLRYLTGGDVDQVVDVPLPDAELMLLSALGLVAQGRNEHRAYLRSVA